MLWFDDIRFDCNEQGRTAFRYEAKPLGYKLPRHSFRNCHDIGIDFVKSVVLGGSKSERVNSHAAVSVPVPSAGVVLNSLNLVKTRLRRWLTCIASDEFFCVACRISNGRVQVGQDFRIGLRPIVQSASHRELAKDPSRSPTHPERSNVLVKSWLDHFVTPTHESLDVEDATCS